MSRLLFASVLAGIAVFLWGFISHAVSPLGEAGLRSLPDEAHLLDTMRATIPERGLYFFPGVEDLGKMTEDQQRAWVDKMKAGPNGLLLFDPSGHEPLSMRQLVIELINDILVALVLAILLGFTSLNLWGRVGFGAAAGLMGWLAISVPYWNWYQFPWAFIVAEGFSQVVAWALAALVLSIVVRRRLATSTDSGDRHA
jgi:hypothetical protein